MGMIDLNERHGPYERAQIVAIAHRARIRDPELAGRLIHLVGVRQRARVEGRQVVANIRHDLGNILGPIAEAARCVFVRGSHDGIGERVGAARLTVERGECDIGQNGNIEGDAKCLGP